MVLQSGAATCTVGFVTCFLKVPPCLLAWAAWQLQDSPRAGTGNSRKTFYKTFGTSLRPRLYHTLRGWLQPTGRGGWRRHEMLLLEGMIGDSLIIHIWLLFFTHSRKSFLALALAIIIHLYCISHYNLFFGKVSSERTLKASSVMLYSMTNF